MVVSEFCNSNEKNTLRVIKAFDAFAKDREIIYATFGGAAVAGYLGHFIRRLHDLDFIIHESSIEDCKRHFKQNGFHARITQKSKKANFVQFEQPELNVICSLFAGKFNLIDIDSKDMPILIQYDLTETLQHRRQLRIESFDREVTCSILAIPIEDLLITKLFPTIEPNNMCDIAILLCYIDLKEPLNFNQGYFQNRLGSLANFEETIEANWNLLLSYIRRSMWKNVFTENIMLAGNVKLLTDIFSSRKKSGEKFHSKLCESEKASGRGRTAIVISHGPYCLDGTAAAACVGRFYGESNVTPFFTHPSNVDRVIKEVTQSSKHVQDLWIADITWKNSETEKYLNQLAKAGWRIFWADHHTIAIEKSEEDIREIGLAGWVTMDKYSAARLLFDYMVSHEDKIGKANQGLLDFQKVVLLADDNDRWVHNMSGSRELALTIAGLSGIDAYRELVHIDSDVNYSPKMLDAYRTASQELSESVALARRTIVEHEVGGFDVKIIAALCNGFPSEVPDALRKDLNKNVIFVLFNLKDRRISLRRSPECNVNLDRIARLFSGGGHPAAAGFDLVDKDGNVQRYLIERVEWALKKLRAS